MRVFRGLVRLPEGLGPTAVTIGNFDGVHLGHKALIEGLVEEAAKRGLRPCAVTFFPHPLKILAPERAPSMIQCLEDRVEEIGRLGVEILMVVPFTLEFAKVTAEDFVREYLGLRLRCRLLMVGPNARFGRNREGDIRTLERMVPEISSDLIVIPTIYVNGARVSSSAIRRMIEAGDMEGAASLIGRPFALQGEVVSGAGRGRMLGFPTANVLADGESKPKEGIYACRVEIEGRMWPAALHLGPIPTFACPRPMMEVHIIGFEGDLVGRRIRIHFLRRLRDIMRFDSVEALRAQIAKDVEEALRVNAEKGLS